MVASYPRFDELMVVWESKGSSLASLFTMLLFVSVVGPPTGCYARYLILDCL